MGRLKIRSMIFAGILILVGHGAAGATTEIQWSREGFAQPESVVVDVARDRLIVSNIDGSPGEADGAGYLSTLKMDGTPIDRRWVQGLDAPKGMGIRGGQLFVTDLTKLHVIDLDTGVIEASHTPEGAKFLNDVTVDRAGQVFVTDLMDHAIYLYEDGVLKLWLRSSELSHPNGILADEDRLVVGSWGRGMRQDFTTEVLGGLLEVDLETRQIGQIAGAQRVANVDGIVRVGDLLIFSDWVRGTIYALAPGGRAQQLFQTEVGVADIGSDGKRVFLPLMMDGRIDALALTEAP